MKASTGDRIIIKAHHIGEPDRDGEILEVCGEAGGPPYRVRWEEDGHEGLFFPGPDASIQHFVHRGDQGLEHPVIRPMIEVYGDVTCPFTHVSLVRLVERRAHEGVREPIHVKSWPLELVNGAPLASALVAEEIAALRGGVSPDLFHGFDPESWPDTSLPALALALAAYRVDPARGEEVSLALRHALFEDGRDISATDVLTDIAERHGIDLDAADQQAVVAEWHEGRRRGVEGSPYFFARGEGFFCPSLDIRHVGGRIVVTSDDTERERFIAKLFGAAVGLLTVRR